MRLLTLVVLGAVMVVAIYVRCNEAASLQRLAAAEEDEDFRPQHHLYRDYGLMRRSARADDAFDDYGHLRFGRSDD